MASSYNFPVPTNIDELLGLLNGTRKLRLSLVGSDGTVQGYYAAEYGTRRIAGNGSIQILNGTIDDAQVLFTTDVPEQAAAFLTGCFLGAFHGRSLEDIHETVANDLQDFGA